MQLSNMNPIPPKSQFSAIGIFPLTVFIYFCLFIIITPSFTLITWAISYDEKRILQLLLLEISAVWLIISPNGANQLLRQALFLPRLSRWLLTAILILGLISVLQSPSIEYATIEYCLLFLLIMFSATVSEMVHRNSRAIIALLITSIAASAFCYEITFFSSYAGTIIQNNPLVLPEPFSGFSNYRFFNQFQIWTFSLILLPILIYTRLFPTLKLLLFILAIGWWILLFASQGRGAQLSLILATIATALVFRKGAWPLLKIVLITAIAGWIIHFFLFEIAPEYFFSNTETQLRGAQLTEDPARLQLWQLALNMVWDNPVFGIGPMHYAFYPNAIAAHPHNSIIQIAVEWGLPVALLIGILVVWGVTSWCRMYFKTSSNLRSKNQHHVWIALFHSLLSGLLYSMVSGVIVMPLTQTMFSVIVGVMLGLYFTREHTSNISTSTSISSRLLVSFILIIMTKTLMPTLFQQVNLNNQNIPLKVYSVGPRLWQEGGIPHKD